MPLFLLFNTFLIGLEHLEQILNLFDLCLGIRVDNLRKILHKSEVSSHGVSQSSKLA